MSFDYSTLITDRAASDSDALKTLVKKPMSQWTAAEAAAFRAATLKGSYDYTDLNRVSACMEDLVARLNWLGYNVPGYARAEIAHTGGSRLPDGYTEVAYIQSSGTQYVDTGFAPNQDTRCVMDAQMTEATTSTFYFGARAGTSSLTYNVLYTPSGIRSDYGTSKVAASGLTATDRLLIDKNKNICTIGDTEIANDTQTYQSALNLFLCAVNGGGTAGYFGSLKLYSCKIYDDDTPIRDYVPCINADNAVGLYDLVDEQFYGNAGTGTFTAGDVVESASDSDTLDPYTWYVTDSPTRTQMEQYRQNVAAVRSVLALPEGTASVPETMRTLKPAEANAIEAVLTVMDEILNNIPAARRHCGVSVCGSKGVIA